MKDSTENDKHAEDRHAVNHHRAKPRAGQQRRDDRELRRTRNGELENSRGDPLFSFVAEESSGDGSHGYTTEAKISGMTALPFKPIAFRLRSTKVARRGRYPLSSMIARDR